jgi:phosphatidyl-myo-inositol dimannoside synthase
MTLEQSATISVFSMYDKSCDADDNKYFPSEMFRGFGVKKIKFITASVHEGAKSNVIILSHINLLLVGWMIKKISPRVKLILLAHGIEVWKPMSSLKKRMLQSCDKIISVSNFTRKKIHEIHQYPVEKCMVLNNCLDPFLPLPSPETRDDSLVKKYGFNKKDKILFTLTRLSAKERYKGYDKVLEAMTKIKVNNPEIRYLLAGSYDREEKAYIDALVKKMDLSKNISMPGYIPDEEVANHFAMADIYVMPSMKEGFGIVFIEAMYYGLPVIAGNLDGSVDALCNGELGLLVNPLDANDIQKAIEKILAHKNAYIPNHELLMKNFSYTTYKNNLENILARLKN